MAGTPAPARAAMPAAAEVRRRRRRRWSAWCSSRSAGARLPVRAAAPPPHSDSGRRQPTGPPTAPTDRSSRGPAGPDPTPALAEPLPFQAQELDLTSRAGTPGRAGHAHRQDHRLDEHGRDQHHRLDDQGVARRRLPAPRGRGRADAERRQARRRHQDHPGQRQQRGRAVLQRRRPGGLDQAADLDLQAHRQQGRPTAAGAGRCCPPRDTARLGDCIADGRAAGPKWTNWLLNEMRQVRGAGDFGIRKAFPAARAEDDRHQERLDRPDHASRRWHINCLAIGDTWTMGVMVRYPIDMGYEYGMKNCEKITEALLRPAPDRPASVGRAGRSRRSRSGRPTAASGQPAKNSGPPSGSAGASPSAAARRANSRRPAICRSPSEKSRARKYVGQRRRVERLPAGGRLGDLVQLGQAQVARAQERLVHLLDQARVGGGEVAADRPDGEDHRQPGPLPPGLRRGR